MIKFNALALPAALACAALANIVLATSEHSLRELSADLASAEKQRRASSAAERNVLALAAGAHIAS